VKIAIFAAGWAAFSFGYAFLAFALVANLFGREGNCNHLAGFALALAIWAALTLVAVRLRGRSGRLARHGTESGPAG
jgi:hypothetical protein